MERRFEKLVLFTLAQQQRKDDPKGGGCLVMFDVWLLYDALRWNYRKKQFLL